MFEPLMNIPQTPIPTIIEVKLGPKPRIPCSKVRFILLLFTGLEIAG